MKIRNAIIVAALMAAAPARAEQAGGLRQARVSYADINTASDAGILVLRHRIQAASRTLCGPQPDLRDLDRGMLYRTCVQQSMQRALDELPTGSLASR
jgi:UrcA family protein